MPSTIPVLEKQCLRGINWGKIELKTSTIGTKGKPTDIVFESTMEKVTSDSVDICAIPTEAVVDISGSAKELNLQLNRNVEKELMSKLNNNIDWSKHKRACFLESIKFAVPSPCVGFEQSTEAGKELQKLVKDACGSTAEGSEEQLFGGGLSGAVASKQALIAASSGDKKGSTILNSGTLVCVMNNLPLLQPSGSFDLVLTTTTLLLTDHKKNIVISIKVENIVRMFMLPCGGYDTKSGGAVPQFFVIALASSVKVGAAEILNLAFQFEVSDVFEEANPFELTLKTEADIKATLLSSGSDAPQLIAPTMTGPRVEVLAKIIKTIAQKPLTGDNAEFSGDHDYCCAIPSLFKGTSGYLYILKQYLLFLHRPATLLPYDYIDKAVIDVTGATTFCLEIHANKALSGKSERHRFASITIKPFQERLGAYLRNKLRNPTLLEVVKAVGEDEDHLLQEEDEEDDEEEFEEEEDSEYNSEDGEANEGSSSEDDKENDKKGHGKNNKEDRNVRKGDKKHHDKHKRSRSEKHERKYKKERKG